MTFYYNILKPFHCSSFNFVNTASHVACTQSFDRCLLIVNQYLSNIKYNNLGVLLNRLVYNTKYIWMRYSFVDINIFSLAFFFSEICFDDKCARFASCKKGKCQCNRGYVGRGQRKCKCKYF